MISAHSPWKLGWIASITVLVSATTALVACGNKAPAPHLAAVQGGADAAPATRPDEDATVSGAACAPGERHICTIPLPSHGNTHDCYTGTRICTGGGVWSGCFGKPPLDAGVPPTN
jgi:hypothetical protein